MKIEELGDDEAMTTTMKTDDLSAEESLSLGDSLFVDEDFGQAVDAYAAALLVLKPNDPTASALKIRILSHRSAAFYRLRRNEDALEDALEAMDVWSAAKGKGIVGLRPGESEICHKRAGVAAMNLQEYQQAKELFEKAQQLATLNRGDEKSYQSYIRQCDYNLKPKAQPSPSPMMDAMAAAASSPASAPVATKSAEKKPAASAGTAKPVAKKPKPAPAKGQAKPTSEATSSNKKVPVTSMPKYQYYQNDKFVTVALLESNVKPENLDVRFEQNHLTVKMTKGETTHQVICGNTYSEVDVEGCKINIKDEKVLIKVKKANLGFEWQELLGKKTFGSSSTNSEPPVASEGDTNQDEDIKDAKPAAAPTAIPTVEPGKTRPYASHRDWDKIEKELENQEKEEKPEGDDAMNKLFQTIYSSADEDTKRAMIKSYQTSGGTVLSTNWGEVKEKDYESERTAPKGMEWKSWEGKKLPMKEDD